MPNCYVDQGCKLALDALKRGDQEFATRNDDDVDPAWRGAQPEHLAQASLRQVAIDSATDFLACSNAYARIPLDPGEHEHRHQPTVLFDSAVEDPSELTASP
jgi:hypothetical protein